MKNTKRALRRHHRERIRKAREEQLKQWHFHPSDDLEARKKWIYNASRFMINTCPNCSCPMCGNPRRHFSVITRQEQRNKLNFEEEVNDLGI